MADVAVCGRIAVVDSVGRMPGSPNKLHLYREIAATGDYKLMATVKETGLCFKVGEDVIQRCEALQLMFSNMCDSASTSEAELIGVDADSFSFWASTQPSNALPVSKGDTSPPSAQQVLSALQVLAPLLPGSQLTTQYRPPCRSAS